MPRSDAATLTQSHRREGPSEANEANEANEGVGRRSIDRQDVRSGGRWTRRQRIKNDVVHRTVTIALWLVAFVPRHVLLQLGPRLGHVVWALWRSGRRDTERNLAIAATSCATRSLPHPREIFAGLGRVQVDMLLLLRPSEHAAEGMTLTFESRAVLERALSEGRGVMFITAHLGPWERMAAALACEGFPIWTVARESYDPRFQQIYARLREARGVHALYRGAPGFAVGLGRALRRGVVVGFPMDLPGRFATVAAPWFGRMRSTASGPAALALKTGAAIVIGTPRKSAEGGYEICIERHETTCSAQGPQGREPVVALTRSFARALEVRVLTLADEWPWMSAALGDCPLRRRDLGPDATKRR